MREFNKAQLLVLEFSWGTVRVANVHIPSSSKHTKTDLDVTNAFRTLTSHVAASHVAFGIIIGDPNEKQQSRLADRLRNAAHGAGHWRYWQTQGLGEGDQLIYSRTLERQISIIDNSWKSVYCKPHYMHGGYFVPTTSATEAAVMDALVSVAGAAAEMVLIHDLRHIAYNCCLVATTSGWVVDGLVTVSGWVGGWAPTFVRRDWR